MQDNENLSIRRNDSDAAHPIDAPRSASSRIARLPLRTSADPTTRLVAEVIGTTAQRAAELLDELGGLEALAFALESDLVAASLPRGRARLVRAAFELARQSIGARPQIGKRLAGASEVWTHMRARLSGAPVEEFWAIALDVRHRVVFDSMLARGWKRPSESAGFRPSETREPMRWPRAASASWSSHWRCPAPAIFH
jgi:hypothetical protein